ncbi:KASH domain-containing protein [Caerostris extrusa]|uniref:KASH domain-containing protein n=1 Tax=Caerostris extrusa TaxID=172846 RepID=A0AAV4NNH4_CAEEX|nr:KASH domain-containing protein [Caerostris extrusa]
MASGYLNLNGAQLTELETLNSCWKKYIDTFHILNSKLNEAELLSSYKNCDTDCHIFEDEVTYALLKDLKELKADGESLKKCLKSTETWKSIQRDLRDLESKMFAHIRPLSVSRRLVHLYLITQNSCITAEELRGRKQGPPTMTLKRFFLVPKDMSPLIACEPDTPTFGRVWK